MKQQDAITGADAASPGPIVDVIVDRARLPAGAIVQIGVPRRVNGDALDQLQARPDGSLLGYGSEYARLWNEAGDAVWSMRSAKDGLRAVAARSADIVAVIEGGSIDSRLTVRDLKSGEVKLEHPYGDVFGLAVSASGRYVAVLGNTLSLVDVTSGTRTIPPRAVIASSAFVADDGTVVAVKGTSLIRWSGVQAEAPVDVAALAARPKVAAWSVDGRWLAWASGARIGVVDVTAGTAVFDVEVAAGVVSRLAISADGARLAVGTVGDLAVWEVGGASPTWVHAIKVKLAPPAAFAPDGQVWIGEVTRVTAVAADGAVRDVAPTARFTGFAADGTAIVTVGDRETGLDLGTLQESKPGPRAEEPVPAGAPDDLDRAEVALDGSVTAWTDDATSECAPLTVWRSSTGSWTTPKPRDCDAAGALGTWVVGPGMVADVSSGTPRIYGTEEEKLILEIPATGRALAALRGSPDHDLVLAVFRRDPSEPGDDGARIEAGYDLEVWSRKTGAIVASDAAADGRDGLADELVRRDGQVVYLGWSTGEVDEITLATGAVRQLGQLPAGIRVIDESPTSRHLSTMDVEGRTLIWPL